MKALVTGANGFIGSCLTRMLAERGRLVRAFVLKGTGYENIAEYASELRIGDVRDPADCENAARGVDVVYHLAAIASDYITKETALQVNYRGTENLLNASVKAGVKRFVFVSSLSVHHFRGYTKGDESAPRDGFLTPYSYSKIKAEDAINKFHSKGEIEGCVVRPGVFPFGPGDFTSFYHLAGVLEKGYFGFVNGGKALLCTAFVENLCDGLMLCGEKEQAAGETFVISDDSAICWRELIEMFCRELGVKPPTRSLPLSFALPVAAIMEELWWRFGAKNAPPLTPYRIMLVARDFYFTNEKAKRLLGYCPKVGLDEAVKKTANWYLSIKKG
ncbi:MAG: NAD-dependent epimerase/dehydratase family protein [Myxococcota bacterium]